eukprot:scpid66504/ scgid13529/ Organic cation/carnitine transporter 7
MTERKLADSPAESSEKEEDDPWFTVDDAVEKVGFGRFQIYLSVFTGMIWMVDAMEIMIMSIISPAARCAFELSDVEVAMITVVVFVGVLIGAPIWGYLTDRYGRHQCLMLSSAFIGVYGAASAFSPNYYWLLALRFLAGFNLACTPQAMTYYSEFLPSSVRGTCVVFIEVFWSIGTVFETALAMAVMPALGWRYLLGFSAIPVTVSTVVFAFFPESPHFLMAIGKRERALSVLKRIAKANKKEMPIGKLVSVEAKQERDEQRKQQSVAVFPPDVGSDSDASQSVDVATRQPGSPVQSSASPDTFYPSDGEGNPLIYTVNPDEPCAEVNSVRGYGLKDLFSTRQVGQSTILLGFIWFSLSFIYYGVALMTVEVLTVDLVVNGTNGTMHCVNKLDVSGSKCELSQSDYITTLWTTAAEFPGLLITIGLMYVMGRRNTIRLEFVFVTVFYALLLKCNVAKTTTLLFIFGVRALITGVFQAVYVYTPEVYPTPVRAMGLGICSTVSRLGSLSTPFVAEVVLRRSLIAGKLIYTAVGALGFIAAVFLPIETKGRALN